MDYKRLITEDEVRALLLHHSLNGGNVGLDTETTDLNPRKAVLKEIVMTGMEPDTAVVFDGKFAPLLNKWLFAGCVILQNFRYDFSVLNQNGIDMRCFKMRDTMLLHHLVDENAPHDLDSIIQARWGDAYKERFWGKYKTITDATETDLVEYACKDVIYMMRHYYECEAELAAQNIPQSLVDHAHRLALALYDTEVHGIQVDLPYLTNVGADLSGKIQGLLPKMRESAEWACQAVELDKWARDINKLWSPKGKKWQTLPKPAFNFGSPDQLASMLYDKLELPVQISWKTKTRTCDDDALEELEGKHPVVAWIREWRGHQKVYDAFIEGTRSQLDGGRIYPSFNVNGTTTGRISHSGPNMGQLPNSGGVRGIYVPDDGCVFVSGDYNQLEVCIGAHFSQDRNLLRIIRDGASLHDITASSLSIPRDSAKTLNFAMQYLCSPYKVKTLLGVDQGEAQHIWNKYWETYDGLKTVIDSCIATIEAGQPIVNPFGRKRRFPGFVRPKYSDPSKGKFCKPHRQAFNALIQGTGGDCMSEAFYKIAEYMRKMKWGKALFTVHDEALIMPKKEYADVATDYMRKAMEDVGKQIGLTVPLRVTVSESMDRWLD